MLHAISSLSAKYSLVVSSYLTPVLNFNACSFAHLTWACSTPLFYRHTVQNILTGSSAAHKTLNFSTHTDTIICWVTCWSLSHWSVQCSLCTLPIWSVQCSLWSLTQQCSVLLMVTVTLQCSVLLMVTVTLLFTAALLSVQNYHKIFAVTSLSSLATLQTCQHIYNAI
jgi:hypothetical protein